MSPPSTQRFRRCPALRSAACSAAVVGMLCLILCGCKTPLNVDALKGSWASIDDVRGPLQRRMEANTDAGRRPDDHEKRILYEEAMTHFEAGEYNRAEKGFKKAASEGWFNGEKFTWKNLFSREKPDEAVWKRGSRVREDALFMLAETYYKQERYPKAQDAYAALMKEYPSTRYLDRSTRQLFEIARNWLGAPDFVTTEEVQQVNLENPSKTERTPVKRNETPHGMILIPNVTDRTRPVFDTPGRALSALKQIWLNDPTGPLADDALMLTASYYFRKGDYQEADRVFSILREEYPKSPHLRTAFVLGSHVKLMSYQGASYDGRQLEEARLLKESALRLFPDLPEKERLKRELEKIEEAKAQRDWDKVEFYRRKRKPEAMAVYCREILRNYPESRYAEMARGTLVELGLERSVAEDSEAESSADDSNETSSGAERDPFFEKDLPALDRELPEFEVDDDREPPARLPYDDLNVPPGRSAL